AHHAELDDPQRRDTLAAMTAGYSPVMLEHLFDEALVWALRRGADGLDWHDLQQAKMTEEIGLKQPVDYTPEERRRIATHEAGHATVAHVVGTERTLDVLSIVKRRDALGLLAHSDREERFTKTRRAPRPRRARRRRDPRRDPHRRARADRPHRTTLTIGSGDETSEEPPTFHRRN